MEYFALAVLLMLFAIFCYGLFLSTSDDFVDSETLQILAVNSNLKTKTQKEKGKGNKMVVNHEKLKELEKSMGKKIEDLTEVERINLFESPSSYGLYDATPCDFLIVGVVLGVLVSAFTMMICGCFV